MADTENTRRTPSDIEIAPAYTEADVADLELPERLGSPGDFPFTRGVHPTMYRGRLWTMRQYAGFGTAEETNRRFRYLLDHGQTGLSVAFDLPTQMGYDSDDPVAATEVGKVGVAIDTVEDMRTLFDQIPMQDVTTSMTINAPAAMLLLLYQLAAEEQGAAPKLLGGTIQNDVLKEYIARGTFIYPPKPALRLITDTFAYCASELPRWNTISISGYHMREAGCTAVQEIAFTFADGVAYVEAAVAAGLDVDAFAPRLSFFWGCHNNFFEEVAKFRAARRLWARIMRDRFGAKEPNSMKLRFHTQTDGATLTAQQPENNVVRVAYQAMAAVLGGTQSLHTNSLDEALGLPTDRSARLALRTQQILGHETGVVDTADPLGGSWFVEKLTSEVEAQAETLLNKVLDRGGAVESITWMKREIEEAAYREVKRVESGEQVVVGVNKFTITEEEPTEVLQLDPEIGRRQAAKLERIRAERDQAGVKEALEDVRAAAKGTDNILHPMKEAFRRMATLGEVCGVLREEWGIYRPESTL
ncbi:MAG TPA: methylmalonyl-CoA mutase family protein [Actinomycetota bacterium]|jgi:methylmalonyl-CoA mutase N-terminal domain/subunit|nr:methylmalonyl-CoA mutase family protein [Actinomycetota bacterium]